MRKPGSKIMYGNLFEIQRFSVHDGPGIRTTLFLKGCSLRCRWCHNPEGLSPEPSLRLVAGKCAGCGACAAICQCHELEAGAHIIRREDCRGCGKCASACPSGALSLWGRRMTPREAAELAAADKAFYSHGGGVTFSGGECLLQPEFVAETGALLKEKGISVAVDTCGNVPWSHFVQVLPYVDLFLYDVKAVNRELHRQGTGSANDRILENLRLLDETGAEIWLRVPVIPGFNDTEAEMTGIAALAANLNRLHSVTLIPYHPLGAAKYRELGSSCPYDPEGTGKAPELYEWKELFRKRSVPVE